MKCPLSSSLFSSFALVGTAALISAGLAWSLPARADTPGRDWLSIEQVTGAIARQGYQVIEIEADDGHWEGEMRKGNLRYDFHADPRTGKLTMIERDYPHRD